MPTRKQVRAFKAGSGVTPRRRSAPRRRPSRSRTRVVHVVQPVIVQQHYDVKVLVVQVVRPE